MSGPKINIAAGRCVRIVRNSWPARTRPPSVGRLSESVVAEALDFSRTSFAARGGGDDDALPDLPGFGDPHQLHQVCEPSHQRQRDEDSTVPSASPWRAGLMRRAAASSPVSDTGPRNSGRDPAEGLEPFFTTKPLGQGTGSVVAVSRHRGTARGTLSFNELGGWHHLHLELPPTPLV